MTRLQATTPGTGSPAATAAPAAGRAALAARVARGAPDLLVCALAGFSIGPMVLVLAGQFRTWTVVPAGLLGAALAVRACGLPDTPDGAEAPARVPGAADVPGAPPAAGRTGPRREVAWTVAAGLLVLAWALYNARYTAENVYATRDPATYDITARWLMDHASLHIHTDPQVFGSPARAIYQGAGFSDDGPGQVYAQGNHLMPALAAVLGWAFGVQGMFRADVVLGALALVALFGLARRVVGAPLATLVTAAMAVSLPMIYVSRDLYSEPLMMVFLMGGAALLHRATRSTRTADFALAGFVTGCSALVRIDAYVALLAVVVSAVLIVGLAADGGRRRAVRDGLALVVAGAVPTVIGWLDVTRLSSGYYRDQHHNISLELAALATLLVAAPVAARVMWLPRLRGVFGTDRVRQGIAAASVTGLVVFFLLLLSRPLWMVGHAQRNRVLETWQRLAGVEVDGTRSYTERSVLWLAQYVGWVTVLLAVVGYSLLVVRAVRRREDALVGPLTLGLAMSALYLWSAQITPDQPWAMRRYVPVVLPILFLAAAVALQRLARVRYLGRVAAAVLGVVVLVVPYRVTVPLRHVREQVPMYGQVQAICRAVGDHGAVVLVDQEALDGYSMTMRAYCGAPAAGLLGASRDELASVSRAVSAHGRTLYVLARDRAAMAYAVGGPVEPFDRVVAQLTPNDINRTPTRALTRTTDVYLGRVAADGRVTPVPPAR